jgi:hypothetical protein
MFRSVGRQTYSRKRSEPILSLGKEHRDSRQKTGLFPQHMSKQATKIRIEHPKFY